MGGGNTNCYSVVGGRRMNRYWTSIRICGRNEPIFCLCSRNVRQDLLVSSTQSITGCFVFCENIQASPRYRWLSVKIFCWHCSIITICLSKNGAAQHEEIEQFVHDMRRERCAVKIRAENRQHHATNSNLRLRRGCISSH